MHYLVFLSLPRFFRASLPAGLPGLIYRHHFVLDCNELARQLGVTEGMKLKEAKKVLGGEATYLEWKSEDFVEASHAWLDVCADSSDLLEPIDQNQAFLDLSKHPAPESVLNELLKRLKQRGLEVRHGVAGCRWLAQLACIENDLARQAWLTPRRFLAERPIQCLSEISTQDQKRLIMLGYRRVGELHSIPFPTLRRQFPDSAFDIRRSALGGGNCEIISTYPLHSAVYSIQFESPPLNADELHAAADLIAQRLSSKLEASGESGHQMRVAFTTETNHRSIIERTFTKSLYNFSTIITALSFIIQKIDVPIVELKVSLLNLSTTKYIQGQIDGSIPREIREQEVSKVITSLSNVFGEGIVKKSLANSERDHFLRAFRSAYGWN